VGGEGEACHLRAVPPGWARAHRDVLRSDSGGGKEECSGAGA